MSGYEEIWKYVVMSPGENRGICDRERSLPRGKSEREMERARERARAREREK
jgi:hypothetical protein